MATAFSSSSTSGSPFPAFVLQHLPPLSSRQASISLRRTQPPPAAPEPRPWTRHGPPPEPEPPHEVPGGPREKKGDGGMGTERIGAPTAQSAPLRKGRLCSCGRDPPLRARGRGQKTVRSISGLCSIMETPFSLLVHPPFAVNAGVTCRPPLA